MFWMWTLSPIIQFKTSNFITFAEWQRLWFHVCPSVRLSNRLVSNIIDKSMGTDFHKIFSICPAWNKKYSGTFWGRLFHAWLDCFTFPCLDCFTLLKLGAGEVLCARSASGYYTPASTKLKVGYTVFTLSVCSSVHLWTESCPLCIFNNTRRIHFIFAHLIKQLQKVCRV